MESEYLEPTEDDLLLDLLSSLGDAEPPTQAGGWYTIKEMTEVAKGLSETQIRARLDKGVQAGTHEKRIYGNTAYYRKLNP